MLIAYIYRNYHWKSAITYRNLYMPETDNVICCKQAVTMNIHTPLAYIMKYDDTYSVTGTCSM